MAWDSIAPRRQATIINRIGGVRDRRGDAWAPVRRGAAFGERRSRTNLTLLTDGCQLDRHSGALPIDSIEGWIADPVAVQDFGYATATPYDESRVWATDTENDHRLLPEGRGNAGNFDQNTTIERNQFARMAGWNSLQGSFECRKKRLQESWWHTV